MICYECKTENDCVCWKANLEKLEAESELHEESEVMYTRWWTLPRMPKENIND